MTNEQLRASIERQIRNLKQDIALLERESFNNKISAQDDEALKKITLKFEMDKAGIEGKIAQLEQEGAKVSS